MPRPIKRTPEIDALMARLEDYRLTKAWTYPRLAKEITRYTGTPMKSVQLARNIHGTATSEVVIHAGRKFFGRVPPITAPIDLEEDQEANAHAVVSRRATA